MARNIEMNYKMEDSTYEVLYLQTQVENISDFLGYMQENYYSKSEIDNGFINKGSATKVVQATRSSSTGFRVNIDSEVKGILALIYYAGNSAIRMPQTVYFGFFNRNVNYGIIVVADFLDNQTTNSYNVFANLTWQDTSLEVVVYYPGTGTFNMSNGSCILFYSEQDQYVQSTTDISFVVNMVGSTAKMYLGLWGDFSSSEMLSDRITAFWGTLVVPGYTVYFRGEVDDQYDTSILTIKPSVTISQAGIKVNVYKYNQPQI